MNADFEWNENDSRIMARYQRELETEEGFKAGRLQDRRDDLRRSRGAPEALQQIHRVYKEKQPTDEPIPVASFSPQFWVTMSVYLFAVACVVVIAVWHDQIAVLLGAR